MKSQKKSREKRIRVRHLGRSTAVFLLVVLFLSRMTDETTMARSLATKGKIAFTLFDNPQEPREANIYVMDADGTHLTRLTETGKDSSPDWSPDGKQLVFASSRQRIAQIFVMNANGTRQRPLTDVGIASSTPDWSPDGHQIAYTVFQDEKNTEIYLMNADGSNQIRLTHHPARDSLPAFSPDGKKIAFLSSRDGQGEVPDFHLYVMNIDGTGVVKLTQDRDVVAYNTPAWSPDGRWIAFTLFSGVNQDEIYRINADGTDRINLTNHPAFDGSPTWSPDSTQIAFSSTNRDGWNQKGIYVMNGDGTGVVRLTPVGGFELS